MRLRLRKVHSLGIMLLAALATATSCTPPISGGTPTVIPSPSATRTSTPSPSLTPTTSPSPTETPSPSPTETPSPDPNATIFSQLPDPQLCSLSATQLTPVNFNIKDNSPRGAGVLDAEIAYVNDKQQRFDVTVSGLQVAQARLRTFVQDLQICLEAIPLSQTGSGIVVAPADDQQPPFLVNLDNPLDQTVLFKLGTDQGLIIELGWRRPPDGLQAQQPFVLFYAVFSKGVNNGTPVYYTAKCQQSAWSQISMSAGAAQVSLWGYNSSGYYEYRQKSADRTNGPITSEWIGLNTTPTNSTFDTVVTGKANGSAYTIYGGWVEGGGGGCKA